MLEPDAPEILQTMVAAAKGGDIQAARLILERILPPIKPTEQVMELAFLGETLTDKGKAVFWAVSTGVLSPGQGGHLMTAIGTLARLTEIDNLETRLAILEKKQDVKP